uniref:Phosphoinositide phospholipase C n=1 Tax=Spongospora subterranea TaxID=70186 RepID=A0A0H5QN72_9EUKA|eukprot:CRZ02997.1 hypothetical protein [Spongospora subterranea]
MDRRRRRHSWPLWPPDRVETTPPLLSSRGLSLCIDIIDWSDIDFRSHNERAKIEQIECLKRVQQGADLCKYGSRGSPHIRFFYVDATGSILRWKSHKKKMEDSMIILSNVSRLQVGQNTPIFERFVKLRTRELKRRSFSLIYGDDCEKTLDIVCSTREENLVWVRALRFLITREAYSKKIDPYRSLLRSFWDRACVRERGVIDIDAVSRLLGNMNITYSKPECKVLFDNAGVHRHDIIDFSTITRLSLRLRSSPKVYFDIFQRYSDSDVAKLSVGLKQFMLFLRTEQNMDMDESEGLALMRRYMSKEGGRDPPSLRIYELISYLTGDQNTLFDPARMNLYQDMTRPLYDYYINSSHNTYLEGDQLKGISSTKMYIKALQEGCRSVEIDCWDGPNGEPVVYHGFTLTSKVLFHEVVQTIQQHAFDTSPFPVTLSLENRCSLPFQRRMAFHLRNILGPMLALPQDEDRVMLPSPSSLQYRIIIKAKLFLNDMTPSATLSSFSAYSFSESSIDQNASESISALAEQGVAPELASMVMLRARKFSSFDMFRGVAACQMTSFSEKKVTKLVKKGLSGRFVCYNTHNLSRVYPSRFRVDSSNLSPFQSWVSYPSSVIACTAVISVSSVLV